MGYLYKTNGVCSRSIQLEVEDGVIRKAHFEGGCHGNLQGVEALVLGQDAKAVCARLKGIRCGNKETSCPDQLARALEQMLEKEEAGSAADQPDQK